MIKLPAWPVPLGRKPIDLDLSRIKKLAERLNINEASLPPIVHVAGTNGKGSTIAFLRSFLEEAGYKCHVYTSPHLVYFNERIVVAGKIISDGLLTECLNETKEAAKDIEVTFFEGTTAAALLAFKKVKADIVLLETGMGGRLDATNIFANPILTIITPISFDHMEFLGDTIKKIAAEKAAIIKNSVPCIVGKQRREALEVIENEAKEKNSPLKIFGKDFSEQGEKFSYVKPALLGNHQLENASAAIAAALSLKNFNIKESHINAGLKNVKWQARIQKLESGKIKEKFRPDLSIYLDGGHNDEGGKILAGWCSAELKNKKIYLIMGMLSNKELHKFLSHFQNKIEFIAAIKISGEEKCFSPEEIVAAAKEIGTKAKAAGDILPAINLINKEAAENSAIIICGSLYLAGEVLSLNQ